MSQENYARILEAAGHAEAAGIVRAMAEAQQPPEPAQEPEPQPKVARPGVPLVSNDPARRQAEVEGRMIGDRLMNSGIGQGWVSGGPLLGGDR